MRDDPMNLAGQKLEFRCDPTVLADAFASSKTAAAMRIKFARPDPQLPPAIKPPAKGKPAKTK
jgi:hypothetical protein